MFNRLWGIHWDPKSFYSIGLFNNDSEHFKLSKPDPLSKFDIVNRYSSLTGTGIICFDNQNIIYTSLSQEEIAYKKKQARLDPASWVYSEPRTITRFDDGTFETNDGITGTWDVLRKDGIEEAIVIKTQAGSLEIPITKH